MAERFYLNLPLTEGSVLLHGAEAHHLAGVCRFRPGDRLYLFNGDGHQYLAQVVGVQKREVELHILNRETPQRELDDRLIVACAVPRGDRAQFLVEKLTELGATTFVPLRTERAVVQPRENKLEKLERWVVEASKQCGRNCLMGIEPVCDWADFCRRGDLPAKRWLAHVGATEATVSGGQDCAFAVGPEGGFTDEEVEAGRNAGWQVVGLGPRILRIETAAIFLTACLASRVALAGGC